MLQLNNVNSFPHSGRELNLKSDWQTNHKKKWQLSYNAGKNLTRSHIFFSPMRTKREKAYQSCLTQKILEFLSWYGQQPLTRIQQQRHHNSEWLLSPHELIAFVSVVTWNQFLAHKHHHHHHHHHYLHQWIVQPTEYRFFFLKLYLFILIKLF